MERGFNGLSGYKTDNIPIAISDGFKTDLCHASMTDNA